jgi:cysteine synthase B
MHGLEGWKHMKTARVPAFYNPALADNTLRVDTASAYDMIKEVAQKQGLLVSPSSAANLWGAIQIASQIESGTVVTVLPDNANNYQEVLRKIFT